MIAAEYIVRFLEDIGVTHIFGIPGYANFPLYGFLPITNIKPILSRYEEGAAFMAYGFGASGQGIGCCCSTSGAASLHLLTGLAAAYANSVPMLVITGQVDTWKIGKCAFQEMSGRSPRCPNATPMFKETTIFSEEPLAVGEIPAILARAYAALSSPRPGPVHISLPIDLLKESLEPIDWREIPVISPQHPQFHEPDLDRVLDHLRAAKAPMVLFGRGCRHQQETIRQFIDTWDIPFATTLQGKGVACHESPWNLGILGTAGSPRANAWIQACDLLLVIGSSLNEFTTSVYTNTRRENLKIVRVDIDPATRHSHVAAKVTLIGDAGAFLQRLALDSGENCRDFEEPLRQLFQTTPVFVPIPQDFAHLPGVSPMDIVDELSASAPHDAIFVADAGNNAAWVAHRQKLKGSQEFHIDINTGCMGNGVASAIGLQVANPRRQVVAVVGDGGMYMLGNEISTAVDHQIPVIWIVFNDEKLGMVKQGLEEKYGIPIAYEFAGNTLATWAQGLGAEVRRIETAHELRALVRETFASVGCSLTTRPLVVDVKLNDAYLPKFYPRAQRTPDEDIVFAAVQHALARKGGGASRHLPPSLTSDTDSSEELFLHR